MSQAMHDLVTIWKAGRRSVWKHLEHILVVTISEGEELQVFSGQESGMLDLMVCVGSSYSVKLSHPKQQSHNHQAILFEKKFALHGW